MNPNLTPTECLDFEPEEARTLLWMPFAVRHKLDEAHLKLKLDQWQRLSLGERAHLVRSLGNSFAELAVKAGARPWISTVSTELPDPVQLSRALGCSRDQANQWLNNASPFACYLMAKHKGPHIKTSDASPSQSIRQQI